MPEDRSTILANVRRSLKGARLPAAPEVKPPTATPARSPSDLAEQFAAELEVSARGRAGSDRRRGPLRP
jgi:hypothetical protein